MNEEIANLGLNHKVGIDVGYGIKKLWKMDYLEMIY